jgi:mono/diheme cytochrome c family protein
MSARIALSAGIFAILVGACAGQQQPSAPSGAATFATHCAACHGPNGEGDGPVAGTMRVTVPNLRTLTARNQGVFPAETVASYIDGRDLPASHGDRYMPIWGDVFDATGRLVNEATGADARIEAVVSYLRELQFP